LCSASKVVWRWCGGAPAGACGDSRMTTHRAGEAEASRARVCAGTLPPRPRPQAELT
jgi:hypothetical protein